jgi:hypothetical protein
MTNKKAQLGQFMTKKSDYILQGMSVPRSEDMIFIEPFAGNGDLVDFLISCKISKKQIHCYDIEPMNNKISLYVRCGP